MGIHTRHMRGRGRRDDTELTRAQELAHMEWEPSAVADESGAQPLTSFYILFTKTIQKNVSDELILSYINICCCCVHFYSKI